MVRAWEIAKEGQMKFGGKVKEFFAAALKIAWEEVKGAVKKSMQEVADMIRANVAGVQVNVWEKYGKRRIYINKGFKNQVAMLEFDQEDNFLGETELTGMVLFGARQAGIEEELIKVYKVVEAAA